MTRILFPVLREFLPVLIMMGSSLITVGIMTIIGKLSLGAFLALVGGWLGFGNTQGDAKVLIEAGKYKVTGVGVGVGILIAGLLIIMSVLVAEVAGMVSTMHGHGAGSVVYSASQ